MSDRVEVVCRECAAKLTLRGTPDQLADRSIRCPKCQAKFIVDPKTIHMAGSSVDFQLPKPSKKRTSTRITAPDDGEELPEAPRVGVPRPKRSAKREETDEDAAPTKKQKKKKQRPPVERSLGTSAALWTLGGIVGGLVGGGIWGLVAYLTGWEVGFLSILIGTAVGIGVRLGAAQCEGWMPATTAVGLTLVAVFLSKLTLNYTFFYDDLGGDDGRRAAAMSQEELIAQYGAEVVAPEFRKAGKPVVNQQIEIQGNFEKFSEKNLYHPAFWTEAESRWKALSPQEQAAFKQLLTDRAQGIDRRSLIQQVAEREVQPEFERANKPVLLTEAELMAGGDSIFKPEVLEEAEKRFDAKTPAERAAFIESIRGQHAAEQSAARGMMLGFVLIYTLLSFLWPGTIICLILACISAYQIGNYDGITT